MGSGRRRGEGDRDSKLRISLANILFVAGWLSGSASGATVASRPAAATRPASASTRPAEVSSPLIKLSVYPSSIQLDHKADLQRIVLVGTYDNGETRDLTSAAKLSFTPAPLAVYEAG